MTQKLDIDTRKLANKLADLLIKHGVIQEQAVSDAEVYDNYFTCRGINETAQELKDLFNKPAPVAQRSEQEDRKVDAKMAGEMFSLKASDLIDIVPPKEKVEKKRWARAAFLEDGTWYLTDNLYSERPKFLKQFTKTLDKIIYPARFDSDGYLILNEEEETK